VKERTVIGSFFIYIYYMKHLRRFNEEVINAEEHKIKFSCDFDPSYSKMILDAAESAGVDLMVPEGVKRRYVEEMLHMLMTDYIEVMMQETLNEWVDHNESTFEDVMKQVSAE
jgi:hypothetical protein